MWRSGFGILVEIPAHAIRETFFPEPGHDNHFSVVVCPQTKAGRGEDPRGEDTDLLGVAQEGGSGAARHVSHMHENQVRRRRRPHLQLLQHPVLRTLRRKGQSTVEQGTARNSGKEAGRCGVR